MDSITFTLGFEEYRVAAFLMGAFEDEIPLTDMGLDEVFYEMDRSTLQWLVLELPFSDHFSYEMQQTSDSELIGWLPVQIQRC